MAASPPSAATSSSTTSEHHPTSCPRLPCLGRQHDLPCCECCCRVGAASHAFNPCGMRTAYLPEPCTGFLNVWVLSVSAGHRALAAPCASARLKAAASLPSPATHSPATRPNTRCVLSLCIAAPRQRACAFRGGGSRTAFGSEQRDSMSRRHTFTSSGPEACTRLHDAGRRNLLPLLRQQGAVPVQEHVLGQQRHHVQRPDRVRPSLVHTNDCVTAHPERQPSCVLLC